MRPVTYITEDAVEGIQGTLDAIATRLTSAVAALNSAEQAARAYADVAIAAAADSQISTFNTLFNRVNEIGEEQVNRVDKAYDDPDEDADALSRLRYSTTRPVWQSNPNSNQAQSFVKHAQQERWAAHDGFWMAPVYPVTPFYFSTRVQINAVNSIIYGTQAAAAMNQAALDAGAGSPSAGQP